MHVDRKEDEHVRYMYFKTGRRKTLEELATFGSKDGARSRAMMLKGIGPVAGRSTNALDAAWLDLNEKKKAERDNT